MSVVEGGHHLYTASVPKPYIPNDKWSRKAAEEGYRARSVYKLKELQERFGLLRAGMVVLDLGAAPGSWMQYAAKVIGGKGKIIGIDLQEIAPVEPNVQTYVLDMLDRPGLEAILKQEGIATADIVLSDIAPNTSGVKDVDQWKSIELAQAVLAAARDHLRPGGKCVVKVFRGADFDEFFAEVRRLWRNPKIVTVEASRDRSREAYLVVTR